MNDEIRIYVACLAAYNAGHLHGRWIDATLDLEDMQKQVSAILKSSPIDDAEEFAIHDYEGFGGYGLSEYEGLEAAHEIACFIEDYPALGGELLNHFGGSLEDARKAAEDNYSGCYTSLAAYAEELTDNTADIPDNLAYYLDYERMGRDMELSGDIYTVETSYDEVHVFWSH